MGNLMILLESKWFDTLEMRQETRGTASEGGVLVTEGTGRAGNVDDVYWSSTVSYSVVAGNRIREKGFVFVDASPPFIATSQQLEPVLLGQHIEGLPCFDMEAFLRLAVNHQGV